MKIKIVNESNNPLPKYETIGSSGMDLRANLKEEITLKPFERQLIPTGIFLDLPEGYEAQIRPRSGLAFKHGITVLNTPGTVDSDYFGEIKIILINLGSEEFKINNNDRIAQMVIAKQYQAELEEVLFLVENSKRGSGGFGHTGKQ